MTTEFEVIYTPVFKSTLSRLSHFLNSQYSKQLAQEVRNKVRKSINETLAVNPYIGPVSDRLLTLGISDYRQLLVDEHNLILYKIDKEKVIIHAIMDTRQNINDVLFDAILKY